MDDFNILTMFGGLALFLYGMDTMGQGLSALSHGKMKKILRRLTTNKIRAVLLGTGVTAVIQSSSATTVMAVGFVDAGLMTLSQATGVIMGANVGTTMTSWLLSLVQIQGESLWMQMFKPSFFSPVFSTIGVFLILFTKQKKKKIMGMVLTGFAILMTGMDVMSNAVRPLASCGKFTSIFLMFSHPLSGVAAGTILTAVIQSSSASIGILQALCMTGAIKYSEAIPLILGQNIGTCVTAILASVQTGKNGKRAAVFHLYFNMIGAAVFSCLFYLCHSVVCFPFMDMAADAAGIAMIHTVFNIFAVAVLFPFSGKLEKLAIRTISGKRSNVSCH